jgi:hypothetical protein
LIFSFFFHDVWQWEKLEELIAAEQQERQIPIAAVTQQYSGSAVGSQHPVQVLNYSRPQSSNGLVEQPRQQVQFKFWVWQNSFCFDSWMYIVP